MIQTMIAAVVLDKTWAVQHWMNALLATTDVSNVGLAIVIHPQDHQSREIVTSVAGAFGWVEIVKYAHNQSGVTSRDAAVAKSMLMRIAGRVRPRRLAIWDPDYLPGPGAFRALLSGREDEIRTTWTWINRQPPEETDWLTPTNDYVRIRYQPALRVTASKMVQSHQGLRPAQFSPEAFVALRGNVFDCDYAIGPLVMGQRAYYGNAFTDAPNGEYLSFLANCRGRGLKFVCDGGAPVVKLTGSSEDDEILALPIMGAFDVLYSQTPLIETPSFADESLSDFCNAAGIHQVRPTQE